MASPSSESEERRDEGGVKHLHLHFGGSGYQRLMAGIVMHWEGTRSISLAEKVLISDSLMPSR